MSNYHYEVVVCPTCKGEGHKTHHEYTSYHKGEYDVVHTTCHHCGGEGRLRKKTVVTFERMIKTELAQ